jgi:DNA-binding response OmpR family regulator
MESKRLLLVEDQLSEADILSKYLKEAGWQVTRANDRQDAFYRIKEASKRGEKFDFFAIDLGLPPLDEDHAEEGVRLAVELRERFEEHPILAYTAQGHKTIDYDLVLRQLLVARISFIYRRRRDERLSFAEVVQIVNEGYLVISPTPAAYLPLAIPSTPDPLSDKHWQALKLLNEDKTYAQVGKELDRSPEAIQKWVNEMRDALAPFILPADLVDAQNSEAIQLEDLKIWYRNNRVKYCRE